ncbi:PVC-type heme-binding CxxCH protein [Planctomycetota bacterium]
MSYLANGTCNHPVVKWLSIICLLLSHLIGSVVVAAEVPQQIPQPRVFLPGYTIELVAQDPQIVTPVGITFDQSGRLLVIESHTHHRPEDYDGPKGDRILAFALSDPAGDTVNTAAIVKSVVTYYQGTTHTMSLATATDGSIFVATRREIFRLRDTTGDGVADTRTPLVSLKTEGAYPHNGLSGLVFGPDGYLYFGMGENLGFPFELVGSDGSSLTGHGDGGSVYRCRPDGASLERYATGFWNPFGNCFDDHGRLFSVDNDPDASPPCRLIHVVPTADYGYQFRYGRSGRHPLQTWTGDLPGTLGPVAGTGEAPCEMIAHNGQLWVASWGDHRIETFDLHPAGATVSATRQIIVQGDKDFRPVGMKLGPDGSIYFSDWVDRSYPVHGRGRIWRLRRTGSSTNRRPFPPLSDTEKKSRQLRVSARVSDLDDDDPFVRQSAVAGIMAKGVANQIDWSNLKSARQRVGFLQAIRWKDARQIEPFLSDALSDRDNDVRLYALRVIADQRLTNFRDDVVHVLETAADARTLASAAATIAWLDDGDESKNTKPVRDRVAAILGDDTNLISVRLAAMMYLPVDDEAFSVDWLLKTARSSEPKLATEAVHVLALQRDARDTSLLSIARDEEVDVHLRADAIAGVVDPKSAAEVRLFLESGQPTLLQGEANRTLRQLAQAQIVAGDADLPAADDTEAWLRLMNAKIGNVAAGRRVFFRAAGTSCVRCHSHGGRGSAVGPDLTKIHARATTRFLLESILTPAREVAPQYTPIAVTTEEGRTHVGIPIEGPTETGMETFVGPDGKEVEVPSESIESRQSLKISIMPNGFESLLSVDELRDVIAFLSAGSP